MQSDREKNPELFFKAEKLCLRLLSVRQRSEKEIFDRLKFKGFGLSISKDVVGALRAGGLLDDKKFAEEWVDARLRMNPRSKSALEVELCAKGISIGTIEEVFAGRKKELEDRAIASKLIESKMLSDKDPIDIKKKAKVYRFLLSKGIDREIAEEMINEL